MAKKYDFSNMFLNAEIKPIPNLQVVKYAPTADVVSKKVFEQVKWERDTAIEQLESYGVGFCENKELVEVKHGYWILEAEYKDGTADYKCSVCDYDDTFSKNLLYFYRYCPYCGADMRGEKK